MNPAFLTFEQLQERPSRLLSMYASLIEQANVPGQEGAFREAEAVRKELRAVQGELLIRNQRKAA